MTRHLLPEFLLALLMLPSYLPAEQIPRSVPPRRSTQLADGFGMNQSLPREPRLPWSHRWWTRMFDAGVKWVRLGQYENSSDLTSWDWVEQTPGHYAVVPDLDEAIRSLAENGVGIEIELQYSNPLYQGNPAVRPQRVILPPPGIGPDDEPVNPIFVPPKSDKQVEAFLKYVRFMVGRYKGVVKHWELWNEPNIGYWRPHTKTKEELVAKAREYAKVLSRFADAVHETDPQAQVLSGGTAGPDLLFVRTALAECASKIDLVAYHTYPGFGSNHMPEEADTHDRAVFFREQIRSLPGMHSDVVFWNNEWNVSPKWENSNESVQARYVPRFYLYHLTQQVKGFMWTFVPGTDANEDDFYGILHGDTQGPDAFQPREAYRAFQVTSALFGQTLADSMAEFHIHKVPEEFSHGQLQRYAFRDTVTGKRIYAFWLAVYADPADRFVSEKAELALDDSAVQTPILIDVRTGAVTPLGWKDKGVVEVPLKESVMAVADASYLDWPELPETPGELRAWRDGGEVKLRWKMYGPAARVEIQRSRDYGPWQAAKELAADATEFAEPLGAGAHITYRVRAWADTGTSAWSNPAWVQTER